VSWQEDVHQPMSRPLLLLLLIATLLQDGLSSAKKSHPASTCKGKLGMAGGRIYCWPSDGSPKMEHVGGAWRVSALEMVHDTDAVSAQLQQRRGRQQDKASKDAEIFAKLEMRAQAVKQSKAADELERQVRRKRLQHPVDQSNIPKLYERGVDHLLEGDVTRAREALLAAASSSTATPVVAARAAFLHTRLLLVRGELWEAAAATVVLQQQALAPPQAVASLRHDIADASALWQEVKHLWGLGAYKAAHQTVTKLLSTSWHSAKYYIARARLALKLDEFSLVRHDAVAALRLRPHSATAFALLGHGLWCSVGHAEHAMEAMARCLRLDPERDSCRTILRSWRQVSKSVVVAEEHATKTHWGHAIESAELSIRLAAEAGQHVHGTQS